MKANVSKTDLFCWFKFCSIWTLQCHQSVKKRSVNYGCKLHFEYSSFYQVAQFKCWQCKTLLNRHMVLKQHMYSYFVQSWSFLSGEIFHLDSWHCYLRIEKCWLGTIFLLIIMVISFISFMSDLHLYNLERASHLVGKTGQHLQHLQQIIAIL